MSPIPARIVRSVALMGMLALFSGALASPVYSNNAAMMMEDRSISVSARQKSSPVGASVNVNIDPLQIGQAIANAVSTAQNREAFVKNALNTMIFQTQSAYSIMVFNLQQNYEWRQNPTDVVHYQSADYGGIKYGIWAFRTGDFMNNGDGGYINWAFYGNFERDGGHVVFK